MKKYSSYGHGTRKEKKSAEGLGLTRILHPISDPNCTNCCYLRVAFFLLLFFSFLVTLFTFITLFCTILFLGRVLFRFRFVGHFLGWLYHIVLLRFRTKAKWHRFSLLFQN